MSCGVKYIFVLKQFIVTYYTLYSTKLGIKVMELKGLVLGVCKFV